MKNRIRIALSLLLAGALSLAPGRAALAATEAQAAAPARPQPCFLQGYGGMLRCLKVTVPADHARPAAGTLDIHVTIAPAFREAAKSDPLYILAGGPGQAGSDILMLLDAALRPVRATRDIVLIDQRGTGLSGKLDCESTRGMEDKSEAEQERALADCLASLKKPFSAYTTDAAARDIEAVRSALGHAQVNLWGGSYGTRLAQHYARRFPDKVRSLILDGVASPEQIIFAWGGDAQAALDKVFARCAADAGCRKAYPDLPGRFAELLARARAGKIVLEFRHPRTAQDTRLALPADAFLQTVRAALYSSGGGARLPFVIDAAARGNWSPFLALLYAPDDYRIGGMATGLLLSVTCAEDIPRLTPAIISAEQRASFLAGMEMRMFPRLCRLVDVPPVAWTAPSRIEVPVLLLSGELDPVTPPRRAEEAMRHMARAQHLVAPNVGHGVSHLGCAPRLMRSFLDAPGKPLDGACLRDIPATGFQLGAAGPQP